MVVGVISFHSQFCSSFVIWQATQSPTMHSVARYKPRLGAASILSTPHLPSHILTQYQQILKTIPRHVLDEKAGDWSHLSHFKKMSQSIASLLYQMANDRPNTASDYLKSSQIDNQVMRNQFTPISAQCILLYNLFMKDSESLFPWGHLHPCHEIYNKIHEALRIANIQRSGISNNQMKKTVMSPEPSSSSHKTSKSRNSITPIRYQGDVIDTEQMQTDVNVPFEARRFWTYVRWARRIANDDICNAMLKIAIKENDWAKAFKGENCY